MSALSRIAMLAPFRVRSFRFQWPADLLTSWGFEMENLILSWYVLVETQSVLLLTLFGALQYLGTLIAPIVGMAGDRLGHRAVLVAMRAIYAILAAALMALAFTGTLRPVHVFAIAALSGLLRPSDLGMRNALVAEIMPPDRLMASMGVSRTTSDSARIAGSLAGAGLYAALGMGPAYLVIMVFYAMGCALTMRVAMIAPRPQTLAAARLSPLRDLGDGMIHVWRTPCLLAGMWLAFLVNMTAFPITGGLMPYIARNIYHVGQTGYGTLVASFAFGALLGSIGISLAGRAIRPARQMIIFTCAWYTLLLGFVLTKDLTDGRIMLVLAGFAQSLSMVPLAVMLLNRAGEGFRGRVMGVRMLAIYGLPLGLLAAGAMIDLFGYVPTASFYCVFGLAMTLLIALRWRADLWPRDAPANAR
jgi:MFS family permease